jgi:hypothetical protein
LFGCLLRKLRYIDLFFRNEEKRDVQMEMFEKSMKRTRRFVAGPY